MPLRPVPSRCTHMHVHIGAHAHTCKTVCPRPRRCRGVCDWGSPVAAALPVTGVSVPLASSCRYRKAARREEDGASELGQVAGRPELGKEKFGSFTGRVWSFARGRGPRAAGTSTPPSGAAQAWTERHKAFFSFLLFGRPASARVWPSPGSQVKAFWAFSPLPCSRHV